MHLKNIDTYWAGKLKCLKRRNHSNSGEIQNCVNSKHQRNCTIKLLWNVTGRQRCYKKKKNLRRGAGEHHIQTWLTDAVVCASVRGSWADSAELPQPGRSVRPEVAATGGRVGRGPAPGWGSLSEGEGAEGGAPESAAGDGSAAGSTESGMPQIYTCIKLLIHVFVRFKLMAHLCLFVSVTGATCTLWALWCGMDQESRRRTVSFTKTIQY